MANVQVHIKVLVIKMSHTGTLTSQLLLLLLLLLLLKTNNFI
jgi:hypothetical protein